MELPPKGVLRLSGVEDPVEQMLRDVGYDFSEDSDQPGKWVWMAPSDGCPISYESRDEAVAAAFEDASQQARSIAQLQEHKWAALSLPEKLDAIESALCEEPVRERE